MELCKPTKHFSILPVEMSNGDFVLFEHYFIFEQYLRLTLGDDEITDDSWILFIEQIKTKNIHDESEFNEIEHTLKNLLNREYSISNRPTGVGNTRFSLYSPETTIKMLNNYEKIEEFTVPNMITELIRPFRILNLKNKETCLKYHTKNDSSQIIARSIYTERYREILEAMTQYMKRKIEIYQNNFIDQKELRT